MSELSRQNNKQNPFKQYFANFGIRQASDLTILLGAIVIIFGLIFDTKFANVNVVTLIGGIIYLLGLGGRLYVSILSFKKIKNKRSPLYNQGIINFVVIGILIALSILLIVYSIR